eukprot:g909.t1
MYINNSKDRELRDLKCRFSPLPLHSKFGTSLEETVTSLGLPWEERPGGRSRREAQLEPPSVVGGPPVEIFVT